MDVKRWLRANWDRAAAWFCVVLGVVFLFIGWEGVSKSAYPAEQLPFILSGGIGGALMVALGATLLISADLRDEWQKLDRIEKKLDQVTLPPASSNGSHAVSGPEQAQPEDAEPVEHSDLKESTEEYAGEVSARRTRHRPLTARRDDH